MEPNPPAEFTEPSPPTEFMQTQVLPTQSTADPGHDTEPEEEPEEDKVKCLLLPITPGEEVIRIESGSDFTLGRGPECSHVTKQDPYISTLHFTISSTGNSWELRDSSSNGTTIHNSTTTNGGKRLKRGDTVELVDGTEIVVKRKANNTPDKIGFVFLVHPANEPIEPGMLELKRKYQFDQGHESFLGQGSFAKVYKGIDRDSRRPVAIKVVEKKKLMLVTSSRDQHFEDEFRIMKTLKHSGVVQVYDVYDSEERLYIVLEQAVGGELFDAVVKEPYSEPDARHVFTQIVKAIKYLHENNVVHRDIKPENILISSKASERAKQVVKISDFGLSRLAGPQSFMQTVCGTPQYLAPEVLTAKHSSGYNQQVDMWSLGVILYILVSGTMPFAGPTESCPYRPCLLYTSDAADEEDSVDLGGRRIIKKKKKRLLQRE
eukprot:TRINITY_DN43606_c0_g1_i4.p1 TRINITY_DN43606_c0_g1~~TRINITY_DN43606_c0_g1_i4.p1  ORF type:complete len:433 (-),score=93.18 TRINITY_DN43606_c0_g1_i4:40-1338(-)